MKKVGIADLKAHLSEYLRTVRKGRSLTVVDRDTPIARISPYQTAPATLSIRQATKSLSRIALPPPLGLDIDSVELLLEERQNSR